MPACRLCETAIPSGRTFCSRSCAATYNNAATPKRVARNRGTACASCSAPLKAHQTRFCSLACAGAFKSASQDARIERGEVRGPATLKRYLIRTRGHQCEVCGAPPVHNNKPLTLQLDHIDGDSDHNAPSNLRLICPNCHAQTDTFTSKQKKFTERNRYLRAYKGYT